MMKLIIFIAIYVACVTAQNNSFTPLDYSNFYLIAGDCIEQVNASQADIDAIMMHIPAPSRAAKCIRACIMQKFNLLDKSGRFNSNIAMKFAETFAGSSLKMFEIYFDVIATCAKLSAPADLCEAGEKYKMCLITEARLRDI